MLWDWEENLKASTLGKHDPCCWLVRACVLTGQPEPQTPGRAGEQQRDQQPAAQPAPGAQQQPGRSLWDTFSELVMWGWLGLVPPTL